MDSISYPLRIPKEIMVGARLRAKEEHVDQATALKQLLYLGLEKYILALLTSGRISIGKAAELLNTPIQDIYTIANRHHISLGATAEQQKKSEAILHSLKQLS